MLVLSHIIYHIKHGGKETQQTIACLSAQMTKLTPKSTNTRHKHTYDPYEKGMPSKVNCKPYSLNLQHMLKQRKHKSRPVYQQTKAYLNQ